MAYTIRLLGLVLLISLLPQAARKEIEAAGLRVAEEGERIGL